MKARLLSAAAAAALFFFPTLTLAKSRPARRNAHAARQQDAHPQEGRAAEAPSAHA